jgi:hypothetical protein
LSPILVRPVREQLEHDRVIRLLQAKYKRKFEVGINPGSEQAAPVMVGTSPWFPDLVLYSTERGRKLLGTVEVETAESVNNLEAMSQWKTFSRLRAPFHLYVPVASIDTARRMAAELQIPVAEIWVYSALGDQMRFTLVQRSAAAEPKAAARPPAPPEPKAVPARAAAPRPAPSRAARPNGPTRGSRPSTAPPARRTAATGAAKARKAAPAAKRTAKTAAPRRTAAKKTAARAQKRK